MKKKVLLKISGELFSATQSFDSTFARAIAKQLWQLRDSHWFGIVLGGGNVLRGKQIHSTLKLNQSAVDSVGMLATVMNGIIFNEILVQEGIDTTILSALHMPELMKTFSFNRLRESQNADQWALFVGGLANPFFSTDTTAVVRALQCNAVELWKATKVDHVYDKDPAKHANAQPIQHASYADILTNNLHVMDMTAITLAQENNVTIRIFNIFADNALSHVANNPAYGSTIS